MLREAAFGEDDPIQQRKDGTASAARFVYVIIKHKNNSSFEIHVT